MNFVNIGQHTINLDNVSDIDWHYDSYTGYSDAVKITLLSINGDGEHLYINDEAKTVRRELRPFFEQRALLTIELE